MEDMIPVMSATAAYIFENKKIKTHYAEIIVGGNPEKPCFHIRYYDPTDKEYHLGFSSYCLDYVFQWLEEAFEIVEHEPPKEEV